jgi:hypothetical protein
MPVARYFLVVGGVLLALLFAIDAFAPQQQVVVASNGAPSVDRAAVRIHSDQKLPERVVYDTSLPTIVPPVATVQVAAPVPPAASEATAETRARDTFAEYVPAEAKKKPEPQVQRKRKIAKSRSTPPVRVAQQQQPQFGFFGGWGWNNTW